MKLCGKTQRGQSHDAESTGCICLIIIYFFQFLRISHCAVSNFLEKHLNIITTEIWPANKNKTQHKVITSRTYISFCFFKNKWLVECTRCSASKTIHLHLIFFNHRNCVLLIRQILTWNTKNKRRTCGITNSQKSRNKREREREPL